MGDCVCRTSQGGFLPILKEMHLQASNLDNDVCFKCCKEWLYITSDRTYKVATLFKKTQKPQHETPPLTPGLTSLHGSASQPLCTTSSQGSDHQPSCTIFSQGSDHQHSCAISHKAQPINLHVPYSPKAPPSFMYHILARLSLSTFMRHIIARLSPPNLIFTMFRLYRLFSLHWSNFCKASPTPQVWKLTLLPHQQGRNSLRIGFRQVVIHKNDLHIICSIWSPHTLNATFCVPRTFHFCANPKCTVKKKTL